MQMKKSDDIICGSTKTIQLSIMNISRNIVAVFFKLGTKNVHHKKKQNDTCYVVTMGDHRSKSRKVIGQLRLLEKHCWVATLRGDCMVKTVY